MRAKLETLSLMQLREIAKANGMKSVTIYRKSELIDKLVSLSESQTTSSNNNSTETTGFSDEPSASDSESDKEKNIPQDKESAIPSFIHPQEELSQNSYPNTQTAQESSDISEPSNQQRNFTYRRKEYSQDASRLSKRPVNERYNNRFHNQNSNRQTFKDEQSSYESSSNCYPRRNGGYTQAYNQVLPDISSSRSARSLYKNASQEEGALQSGNYKSISRSFQQSGSYPSTKPSSLSSEATASQPQSIPYSAELASDEEAHGILEINPEGFGFLRSENYLTGDNDVYVSPAQIRKLNLKTGDVIKGVRRIKSGAERFAALLYVTEINGFPPASAENRPSFEDLTPIFPDSRLSLETPDGPSSLRILDLLSPIGKGQRGMIVSPPKAGKTTLLKAIAHALTTNYPEIHLIILLIDERPEEVTDIKEYIEGNNTEVIYSTFDEQPEHHKRVSEMVLERAKRLVEHKQDVVILLDSITRLARACNLTVTPSGRTLSGGLDPAALYMPKKFFGAARNMREGGSLTILASALIDTGSRMDDVVFEEFKGTGNMEIVLDRKLSERRIFPAIDICKSGTRRDDLLLSPQEFEAVNIIHQNTNSAHNDDAVEKILDLFSQTSNNQEFIEMISKIKLQ